MLEELQRRNYTDQTIRHYLRFVEEFSQHFGKSPDKLGQEHLRSHQAHVLRQRKLSPGSVEHRICALRFFFVLLAPVPNSWLTSHSIGIDRTSAVISGATANIKNMRTAVQPFRVSRDPTASDAEREKADKAFMLLLL